MTAEVDVKPKPSIPSLPRQYGPMRMPATRYAVTAGSLRGFATRDMSRPAISAIAMLRSVVIETVVSFRI